MKTPHAMMLMVRGQRYSLFSLMLTMTFSFGCIRDVTGQRFEADGPCWGGNKEFDYSGSVGCDTAFAYGKDSQGVIWRFTNSCIGDGLEPVNPPGAFPDCPKSGVGLIQPTAADVDLERMCFLSGELCGNFVAEDDPCWDTEPVVFGGAYTGFSYSENLCCGYYHTSTEITPEMAKDLEPCPELLE